MPKETAAVLDHTSTAGVTIRPGSGFSVAEGQGPSYQVTLREPGSIFLLDALVSTDLNCVMGNAYGLRALMGGMEGPTGGNTYLAIRAIRPAKEPQAVSPFYTPGEIISIVRAAFSLNITELARVLNVKRPTIYAWLGERAEPHGHNLRRLNQVFLLARYWMRQSNVPLGAFVRQADRTGDSLVDILGREVIIQEEVLERLNGLKGKIAGVSAKRKGIRQSAAKRGLDLSQFKDQQDVIDWLTGKRPEAE